MTCYEILTGNQPFLDVHPKDLYRTIVRGGRLNLQRSSCPTVLADYIVKCWETDPMTRPCFAQLSNFMRDMKLYIVRANDPCESGRYFNRHRVSIEPATSRKEAFDESSAYEKLELITRALQTIPPEIKRRYDIYVPEARASSLVFLNTKDSFDLEDIRRSAAELLGRGRFGTTYKVTPFEATSDFVLVVNRLRVITLGKTKISQRLQALEGLKHTNLVSLRAYYISNDENLLIYNYLPNGSLYSLLHIGREPLAWFKRVKIALDVASGLAFLHDSGMVHGNVKSSNILLDNEGNACVADCCLASLVKNPSVVKNTSGYMSPKEYSSGRISKESDVYSFGVVLIELVSGQNPSSFSNDLPTWIFSTAKERWSNELLDVRLRREGRDIQNMLGTLEIAILCSSPHVDGRPRMNTLLELIRGMTTADSSSDAASE